MWNMRVEDEDDKESEAGKYDGDAHTMANIMASIMATWRASWQTSWIEPSKPQCQQESI